MAWPDSSERSEAPRLVALGALKPQSFELRGRRVRIGTAADNDIQLGEPTVSRRHVLLEKRWRRWRVLDLGSTNGTYVNGRRVDASSPMWLRRRDELRLGNARFGFVVAADDVAKIAAEATRSGAPPRRRFSWPVIAITALIVFAGGFGLSEYLVNFSRLELADGSAGSSPAEPSVKSSAALDRALSAGLSPEARASAVAAATMLAGAAVKEATHVAKEVRARTIVAAPPGVRSAHGGSATAATGTIDGGDLRWLARINHYRSMVSLPPVNDDSALSAGERAHTRYLVENYAPLIRKGVDIGAAMHSEDPGKPGYTPIGLRAGRQSDIDEWPGPTEPPSVDWAIDDWMTGAFHRLNILNPVLHHVAYGQWCTGGTCAAALNVVSGSARPSYKGVALPKPVMFPPPGSKVALGPLWGEWPNPVSGCAGYKGPLGLPITLQVGMMTDAKLKDYSFARVGGPPDKLAVCGVDASNYTNPSTVAQQRGRDVLHEYGAVILIPQSPLKKGETYEVSMTVNGQRYKWSFSTAP